MNISKKVFPNIKSGPNIFLTGFMGTGKTTLGLYLAEKWERPFFDTDTIIQEKTKRKISEIFNTDGETYFRDLEKKCIEEWIPNSDAIISTGGGLVTIPQIIEKLKEKGILISLFASPENIYNRIKNNKSRPLLNCADPKTKICELLSIREPFYLQAGVNVLTDNLTLPKLAEQILHIYLRKRKEFLKINVNENIIPKNSR